MVLFIKDKHYLVNLELVNLKVKHFYMKDNGSKIKSKVKKNYFWKEISLNKENGWKIRCKILESSMKEANQNHILIKKY